MTLRHYIAAFLILLIAGLWAYTAYAVSEGALSPGTMADDATVGTVAWTDPDNAKVSDNVYASKIVLLSNVTHYLKATNFGFTIPAGATINGIVVEIEKRIDLLETDNNPIDSAVKIVKSDGTIGTTNKASASAWTSTDTYKSYGSSTDLWGETWTSTDINDVDFGVAFSVELVEKDGGADIRVDHIRITVYYTEAAGGGSQTMVSPVIIFE